MKGPRGNNDETSRVLLRRALLVAVVLADASNAVARWLDARCHPATVVAYGVSMGGNASGLALAAAGPGLYDRWFDIEGANNVVETYNAARRWPRPTPSPMRRHTASSWRWAARSRIAGVVMVHALDDGLVPYDQSREMQAALQTRGLPVQFWTVGTCTSGCEKDTTIDGYASHAQGTPLAGHSNETVYESLVSNTGFDRLDALFQQGIEPTDSGEFVRDGQTGAYTTP
jgi:hypothetical protein